MIRRHRFILSRLRTGTWILGRVARKALFNAVPISMHLRLAFIRGRAAALVNAPHKHVRDNVSSAFSGELDASRVDRIVREHLKFSNRLYLPWILPQLPKFSDPNNWPIHGMNHLDEALGHGNGAILASAHFGYVRMIVPILRAHGIEAFQVAAAGPERDKRDQVQREWLEGISSLQRRVFLRTRVFSELLAPFHLPANLNIRPIVNALQNNYPVLIPGDGTRAAKFLRLPLLATQYPFPTGFIQIAMMTQAPVLPAFAYDDSSSNSIVVVILPALNIDSTKTISHNLLLFVEVFEGVLRELPHLWHRWSMPDCFDHDSKWTERNLEERYNAGAGTKAPGGGFLEGP